MTTLDQLSEKARGEALVILVDAHKVLKNLEAVLEKRYAEERRQVDDIETCITKLRELSALAACPPVLRSRFSFFLNYMKEAWERLYGERVRELPSTVVLPYSRCDKEDIPIGADISRDDIDAALRERLKNPIAALLVWTSMLMQSCVQAIAHLDTDKKYINLVTSVDRKRWGIAHPIDAPAIAPKPNVPLKTEVARYALLKEENPRRWVLYVDDKKRREWQEGQIKLQVARVAIEAKGKLVEYDALGCGTPKQAKDTAVKLKREYPEVFENPTGAIKVHSGINAQVEYFPSTNTRSSS